jgi:pimeloyl-ACP methyl ester carboxylesterase
MPRQPMKDIIVLIPGITGSVLEKDGKVVWGFAGKSLVSSLFSGGKSMRDALMLSEDPSDVDDLEDGVQATKLIPDLHLIPKVWKIDGYSKVAEKIEDTFDITAGENFFEYPYDWRRTNIVAARKLARRSHDGLARWREKTNNPEAKLVIVAHSMGGLVSRYFIEVLEGWKDTRALITFGTPYRGSLNAVDSLVNGVRKGPGGLLDLTELSRSLTGIYELLPIYPCYDPGDGELVRVAEATDIPNVDPARAKAALAFHRAIEAAVEENLKNDAYVRDRYDLYPIVGIHQETNQSARAKGDGCEMLESYKGEDMSGDGTVPRVSAIPIEFSDDKSKGVYAATKHGSLQNADDVLVDLEGFVTGMSLDLGGFRRGPKETQLALEIDDIFFESEPVEVRAKPERSDVALTATVVDSASGDVVESKPMNAHGEWHSVSFGTLLEGAYAVRVTGEGVHAAEDAFAVGAEG